MSETIHSKMAAILADCSAIAKGRKNEQQGYAYRGIDQVAAMLHPLFAKHGVTMLPCVEEIHRSEYQTSRGNTMQCATLKVRWDFIAAEDGSVLSCTTVGEGSDTGDKASNKAMTAAQKYALTLSFTIPWEDQVDGDASSPEPRGRLAPSQQRPEPEPEYGDAGPEEPAWLDEQVGFGKFKMQTWRWLTEGGNDGQRASWLGYLAPKLREDVQNGKDLRWNKPKLEKVEYCLRALRAQEER